MRFWKWSKDGTQITFPDSRRRYDARGQYPKLPLIVLQQTHHIVTHTGPHKVTSSNIHQIKAKSLPNQKTHDATSVCRGVNFYESLKKGTHKNK